MKMIAAYVQPFMLEKVADALKVMRIHGMTVLECKGFGRQTDGASPHFLDEGMRIDFVPKMKIEIVCQDAEVDEIVRTICEHGHTGHHGNGKVFTCGVETVVSIRTGESGEGVL